VKRHLEVLDGLRGTAAISVVIFHFQELSVGLAHPDGLWLRHAYLAVDFFFCLSGYVIGYAYDDRCGRMSIRQFFTARLIRLHPLVVLGVVLGLASFLFDPFNAGANAVNGLQMQNASAWKLAVSAIGGILMIPSWELPNRVGAYFPLNWPSWSLMWEYLANIAYAVLLWQMKRSWLVVVVVLSAVGLGVSAFTVNAVILGFAWGQMLHALARISFSFGAGLLLFRYGAVIRTRLGFGALSLIMLLLFLGPFGSPSYGSHAPFNWIYELAVVLLVFPLIVALGAGAQTSGPVGSLCNLSGRISYPIYMVHYAFVMIFFNYHWTRKISTEALPWAIGVLTILIVLISYGILVLYDEPLRRWLTRRRLGTQRVASARVRFETGGQ
jgi:peptidoglycan/LPS O-acetylase OafA/YrhL